MTVFDIGFTDDKNSTKSSDSEDGELDFSDYAAEIEEKAQLRMPMPPDGTEFVIEVPKATLSSAKDPILFYRIPVGCGLWDAAHALAVNLGESQGDVAELCRRRRDRQNGDGPDADDDSLLVTEEKLSAYNLPVINKDTNTSVIELGCGAAPLPACVAAALGARNVVATDYLQPLIDMAARNLQLNEHNKLHPECTMRALSLAFGDDLEAFDLDPENPENKKFDLVIGADIVCIPREVLELLAKTLDDLTRPGSAIVLSHSKRLKCEESWFINDCLQKYKFKMIGRFEDSIVSRWQKWGRMAHNAQPNISFALEIITFVKE